MVKITLKAAKVNAGYAQKGAVVLIGVDISTIKKRESGKCYPNQPEIEAICETCNVSCNQIFLNNY